MLAVAGDCKSGFVAFQIHREMGRLYKIAPVELIYIQPGKPMQNSYIERFNGTYRRDILDACLFDSLESVREKTIVFAEDYNLVRGHNSLSKLSPVQYLKHLTNNENYQNEFCKYLDN